MIDMCIPCDIKIPTKESDKLRKYKDLSIEVKKTWHITTVTTPMIVGALAMIKTEKENYL